MKRYTVIVERTPNNYSAYAPDLPGCVTTGSTIDETVENMKESIGLHLETMVELGMPIPDPAPLREDLPSQAVTRLIEVAA